MTWNTLQGMDDGSGEPLREAMSIVAERKSCSRKISVEARLPIAMFSSTAETRGRSERVSGMLRARFY